jgi:hypothetical protein
LLVTVAQAGQLPLILPPETGTVTVAPAVELLEDPSRQLSLVEVASAAYAPRFVANAAGKVPNLGRTRSAWWLHFTVMNPSGEPWYVLLDTLLGDEFALYLVYIPSAIEFSVSIFFTIT